MTKLINLMPLLLDIDETSSFEETFAANHPQKVTDKGVKAHLENDTDVSYLEDAGLNEADRIEFDNSFERLSAENSEVCRLTKRVYNYQIDELDDAPRCGGYTGILNQVIHYLVGLAYGSYLREKHGQDCKFFVGSLRSYGWRPDPMMCLLWGLNKGVSGYGDVLAYQHIDKHRYVRSHAGHKKITDGMAIGPMVFVNTKLYGMGDDVFAGNGTPPLVEALRDVIGDGLSAALSELSWTRSCHSEYIDLATTPTVLGAPQEELPENPPG